MTGGYPEKTDVLVAGGGVAGVIAAIAARRAGCDVVLAEACSYPGGMANQALVQPYQTFHSRRGQVIRGIAQEYVDKMKAHGGTLGHVPDPIGFAATLTPMDDRISRHVMLEWLYEEGVTLLLSTCVTGIETKDGALTRASMGTLDQSKMPSGIPFGHWQNLELPIVKEWKLAAAAFVDATGSAKIARLSGAETEMSGQRQPMSWLFALAGVDMAKIRVHIKENPSDFILSADKNAAFGDYVGVSGFFSLVSAAKERGDWEVPRDRLLFFETPAYGEVMVNTTRIPHEFGSDEALREEGMRQIFFLLDFFRDSVPGFKDCYISRKADYMGVRESYRTMAKYVMTRDDVVGGARFDDVIALGAFPIDIHSAGDAELKTEALGERGHYDIPLRSLLVDEASNLVMAGRHIGVTHEAFASTRVMPTCMAAGHAAGCAAAVIAKGGGNSAGGDVYPAVRRLLLDGGAVLGDDSVKP